MTPRIRMSGYYNQLLRSGRTYVPTHREAAEDFVRLLQTGTARPTGWR